MNTETPPPITNIVRLAKSGGLERIGAIAVAVACVGLAVFGVASAPGPVQKPEPKVPAIEIGSVYRLGYSERLHLGVTVPKRRRSRPDGSIVALAWISTEGNSADGGR